MADAGPDAAVPCRLVLHGAPDARAAALDLCHFLSDVVAAWEGEEATEVALVSGVANLGARLEQVGVRVSSAAPARVTTGLEHDAVVLVADDLAVRPPWVDPAPGFCGVELVVPRGGAFGSGEHGSTRAALRVLHAAWASPAPGVVVDVGTGSGILALYAAVRGAGRILACDIDAPSVRAARDLLRDVESSVVLGGPETFVPGCADLVIANMNGAELHESLDAIFALRRNGAAQTRCVLSGMRVGPEEASLRARFGGVAIAHRVEIDGYVALGFGG